MSTAPISDEFSDKYLTVDLGGETCGLAVLRIRELLSLRPLAPLADCPAFVRGALPLRGRALPVVDLRQRLHLSDTLTRRTCLVVVTLALAAGRLADFAFVVDGVGDVVSVAHAPVAPASTALDPAVVLGQVAVDGRTVTLLDVDRVLPAALAADLVDRVASPSPANPLS